MSTCSGYTFTSGLLNTIEQAEIQQDLPVLTPGFLDNMWEDKERREGTNIEENAASEAIRESVTTATNTNIIDTATEEEFEDDGMDQFLMQVMDHQQKAASDDEKINIISDVVVKSRERPVESSSKLRNILTARRCIKTKKAKKFYAGKREEEVIEEDITTEEAREEENQGPKRTKLMESVPRVPAKLNPTVVVVNKREASQNSERSVSPIQSIPAEEEEEEEAIPQWVRESDFTAAQQDAITIVIKTGNKLKEEIREFEEEERRVLKKLKLVRLILKKKRQKVSLMSSIV